MNETSPMLDLYRRWRGGDVSARDPLLATVAPFLRSEFARLLNGRARVGHDSEDLAHNAVIDFLEWGPRFLPESEVQLRALLRRIARNEFVDVERREALRCRGGHLESIRARSASFAGFGPAAPSAQDPGARAADLESGKWMRLALHFLESEDRQLLWSSAVVGQDWATIASELGFASPDAARMRYERLKPTVSRLLLRLRSGRLPDEDA